MTLALITAAVLLVVVGAILAAADGALAMLSRGDLLDEAEKARNPKGLRAIATDPVAHVNALSLSRVIVVTLTIVSVTVALIDSVDVPWQAGLISLAVMIPVVFVLMDSAPEGLGIAHARPTVRMFTGLIRALRVVIGPLSGALIVLGRVLTPGRPVSGPLTSEEQLRSLVDEAAHQEVLEEEDRELLHSVFEFGDTIVREIMVARTDMVIVDDDLSLKDALDVFLKEGVSRIPVVGKDADDIVGVVYLRDLVAMQRENPRKMASTTVSTLAKPALFIPESKKADDTLRYLQAQKNHLAMIVDEYGGIAGLVTLEDLIEELVGDISDEYDEDETEITDLGDDRYRVSSRYSVADLADLYDIDIDDDDVDTVGGLMTKYLGRLPQSGSTTEAHGIHLTAEKTAGRKAAVAWILVQPTLELREILESRREIDQALTGEIKLP